MILLMIFPVCVIGIYSKKFIVGYDCDLFSCNIGFGLIISSKLDVVCFVKIDGK